MIEDPLGRFLLLLAILLLNAIAAALEGAVLALNSSRLKKTAEDGSDKTAALLKIAEEPGRCLAALGFFGNLLLALGTAFAAACFAPDLAGWLSGRFPALSSNGAATLALLLCTLLFLFLLLILAERLPRRLAAKNPEALLNSCSALLLCITGLMRPGVALVTHTADGLLKLLRVDASPLDDAVSEEDIRQLVDLSGENGMIEPEERELIENIFEFNNMAAEDVMIHRKDMVMLYADDSHGEIMATIKESGLSRFPVCGEDVDDIIGILRTREYLINLESETPKPLRQLLAPAYFVPESVATDVLFRDMQKKKIHLAIVVDEYGGTSGLITLEDLLEEIVGNIYDEFDPQEQKDIIKLDDNLWRVSGSAELEELQTALDWDYPYPEDEYETLGGLVFSCLSEIPADGSKPVIEAAGLLIRVEELKDRRIEWATVSLLQPETAMASQ